MASGRRNSLATTGPYADEKAIITSHWWEERRASTVLKIGRRRMWRIITRTPSTAKPPPQRSARVLLVPLEEEVWLAMGEWTWHTDGTWQRERDVVTLWVGTGWVDRF